MKENHMAKHPKVENPQNYHIFYTYYLNMECEQFLNGNGRIVTRASGTEPKIRIMVESEDSQLAELLLNKLKNVTLLLAKCG